MDLFYEAGTSVSVSQSFRSSTFLSSELTSSSLQQQTRQILSESQPPRQNQDIAETRSSANRDTVETGQSNQSQALLSNVSRIFNQIDLMQEQWQDSVLNTTSQSPSISSKTSASTPYNSQFSMSFEMQSYLQLIRQLSNDPESFDKFLDQMDGFLTGETGQDQTLEEYMTDMGQQYGVSAINLQQSYDLKFQVQINNRNGNGTRNSETIQSNQQTQSQQVMEAEPLVFDLDGNGLDLTTVEEGISFDIKGNGENVQTAFVTGNDAFLALDRNGNGIIDSGKELFGDQHGALNGVEELRKFDDNRDGVIDKNDSIYEQLRLFVDRNGDGISQKNELFSLQEEDITAISLNATEENQRISGNRLAASTYYQRSDGSRNQVGEVYLNYLA